MKWVVLSRMATREVRSLVPHPFFKVGETICGIGVRASWGQGGAEMFFNP